MKTHELLEGLEAHYRKPGADRDGEILIREAAPPGSERRADLIRIGLWQSRGAGIDVHELKVSRSDWARELDDKAKAEAWWPYCHRFWIVTPVGLVDPNELPEGWGLMVPGRGRRFTKVVKASTKQPKVTVQLLVELIRRADNARLAEMDVRIQKVREQERKRVTERAQQELPYETRERLDILNRLEKALGRDLSFFPSWGSDHSKVTPEQLGEAMREFLDGHVDLTRREEDLERLRRNLAGGAQHILDALAKDGR